MRLLVSVVIHICFKFNLTSVCYHLVMESSSFGIAYEGRPKLKRQNW